MESKTVIITGCTSGIGRATAEKICATGAKVIMACRNVENAEKVREEISRITNNEKIVVRKLDLASFKSIREFSERINREENRLDVLLHNAGISLSFGRKKSEDGLELTMATNHFGPFLLTLLLVDLLKRSAPSRVIVVASEWYPMGRLDFDNLNPTRTWPGHYNYYVSKYANVVYTIELARRLQGSGVTANCLHPGKVFTDIWRSNTPWLFFFCAKPVLKRCLKTPQDGARTSTYLATSDKVTDISGRYFKNSCIVGTTPSVNDPEKGKKLWELSEKLVKLRPEDPKI